MPSETHLQLEQAAHMRLNSTNALYTLLLLSTILTLTVIGVYVDKIYIDTFRTNLRSETQQQLHEYTGGVESNLNITVQSVIGLASAISAEPNLNQEKFSRQSRFLIDNAPQLRSLSAAPNMVISLVYPYEQNKGALGLNLGTHETQAKDALKAKRLRQLVITGPINLVQGGQALVGRFPVFLPATEDKPEQFWGLVSALLDPKILFENSGLINNEALQITVLSHTDLSTTVLLGDLAIRQAAPVSTLVHLPYGTWEILAAPQGGWQQLPPNIVVYRLLILLVALIIIVPVVVIGRLLKKKQGNENLLQGLIDRSPIGICLNDLKTGHFIFANDAMLAPLGYTLDELKQLTWRELTPAANHANDIAHLKTLLPTGSYGPYEKEHVRKDGSRYPIRVSGILIRDSDNQLKIWSFIEDISAHKAAQRENEQQQKLLEEMGEQARIGAWEFNHATQSIYWSEMTRHIHGVGLDTPITKGLLSRIYSDDESREKIEAAIARAEQDGTPWKTEIKVSRLDGTSIWLLSTGHTEFVDGQCIRAYGACQDISEQVALRNELINAKEEAEAATRAKSEFLATMSHEIRTPVNGVIGMLNLLQASHLDNDQRRKIHLAKNSANALLTLINDILDFSKIEADRLDLEEIDFTLPALFEELVETLALEAQSKGLELSLDMGHLPVSWVKGDPTRLRQILLNLLNNAIKFTQEGGIHVRVYLQEEPDFLLLTTEVIDTGIGISEAEQNRLFQPFSQADTSTTRKYGGTGLGLAITRSLCEMMGGFIDLRSQLGQGSNFTFQVQLKHAVEKHHPFVPDQLQQLGIVFVSAHQHNLESLASYCDAAGIIFLGANNAMDAIQMATECAVLSQPSRVLLLDDNLTKEEIALLKRTAIFEGCLEVRAIDWQYAQAQENIDKPVVGKPLGTSSLIRLYNLANPDTPLPATPAHQPSAADHHVWPAHTRILLVEDNAVNQEVAIMLLHHLGLKADVAENGQAALDVLQRSPPATYHLILMDCQMPIMDGYTASRAIRAGHAGDSYCGVPIIAMTANALQEDRQKCLDAGMNDYLSKPIDDEAFEKLVVRWLSTQITPTVDSLTTTLATTEAHVSEAHVPENASHIWDNDDLLRRIRKPERVAKLAGTMRSGLDEREQELTEAFNQNRWKQLGLAAHSIKGSAGNCSAIALFTESKALEKAAKALQAENPPSDNTLTELKTHYRRTLTAITDLRQALDDYLRNA